AMRGIAGNEYPPAAIAVGNRDPQFPEADMVELDVEFSTCRRMQIAAEIEIVFRRTGRHRCVEKPSGAEIDAAEELPIALEIWMQDTEKRFSRIALEQVVQTL